MLKLRSGSAIWFGLGRSAARELPGSLSNCNGVRFTGNRPHFVLLGSPRSASLPPIGSKPAFETQMLHRDRSKRSRSRYNWHKWLSITGVEVGGRGRLTEETQARVLPERPGGSSSSSARPALPDPPAAPRSSGRFFLLSAPPADLCPGQSEYRHGRLAIPHTGVDGENKLTASGRICFPRSEEKGQIWLVSSRRWGLQGRRS